MSVSPIARAAVLQPITQELRENSAPPVQPQAATTPIDRRINSTSMAPENPSASRSHGLGEPTATALLCRAVGRSRRDTIQPRLTARGTAAAYDKGCYLGRVPITLIDEKPVALATARAFLRMATAAAADGVDLRIVSGFRSHAKQKELYRKYLRNPRRNPEAAKPGHSNHQDGRALDLNYRDRGVYRWLTRHAPRFGFVRTVPSEKWHWEYRPSKAADNDAPAAVSIET